jgi:hypothetical protein
MRHLRRLEKKWISFLIKDVLTKLYICNNILLVMAIPSLPEIIEASKNQEHVIMVPKFGTPIYFIDFMVEMEAMIKRLCLERDYIGPGHFCNWEEARAEHGHIRYDMRFHTYWLAFRTELAANQFMSRVNADDSIRYIAETPKAPLGFTALAPLKKLS